VTDERILICIDVVAFAREHHADLPAS